MAKIKIEDRVGEKYITNEGYEVTIIECINIRNCTAQFKCGLQIKNIQHFNIKRGSIKYPLHPSVYKIGYFGVGKYKGKDIDGKVSKIYSVWYSMLQRCYSKIYQERQPTYKGCSVAEEWHNFQVFAEWFENNYNLETMQGWQFDKDILVKDNKIYSPENCCFVPQEVNKLFTKNNNVRGSYPIGVRQKEGLFQARVSIKNKETSLGKYNSIEEAFQAYKTAKEIYIKEVADKWKDKITDQVYQSLINYKVEITD